MSKLKLSLDDIESKEFNIDFKGYSLIEVDSYLDMVMEDYQTFMDSIHELQEKSQHYQKIIEELSQENQALKGKLATVDQNQSVQPSMLDLVRRISRLEEIVLNQQQR